MPSSRPLPPLFFPKRGGVSRERERSFVYYCVSAPLHNNVLQGAIHARPSKLYMSGFEKPRPSIHASPSTSNGYTLHAIDRHRPQEVGRRVRVMRGRTTGERRLGMGNGLERSPRAAEERERERERVKTRVCSCTYCLCAACNPGERVCSHA